MLHKIKSIPILNSTTHLILRYFTREQLVVLVVLIVVLFMLDDQNIFVRIKNAQTIHQLESEIARQKLEVSTHQTMIEELSSSNANLEKFAREQLYMRVPNEDIFITE